MPKVVATLRFALAEFGPLIVFWVLAATLGVKPAIFGSIVVIAADALWRWRNGLAYTRLYLLTSGLTLVFGLVDLASTSPFMLKYEAVVTNIATGLAFVAGALGEKPIIQEVAETARRGLRRHRRDSRLLSFVHAGLGGLFLPQGRLLPLGGLDPADAGSDGAAVHRWRREPRTDDRGQRDPGPAPVLPLPPPRPSAEASASAADRRTRSGGGRMTIRSQEAAAMLADVDSVVAKVKQSRIYRNAALIIILWGVVNLARDGLIALAPGWFGPRWFLIDAVGVAGTIAILRYRALPGARFPLRTLAAFIWFYTFGWIWAILLGQFGTRQQMAFWPTLFLFGYALAGLWLGAAFTAIGLGVTALIVAGYFWSGDAFNLWLAIVTGGGFVLCGLWMRRA